MNKLEEYNKAKQAAREILNGITKEEVVGLLQDYLKKNNLYGIAWLQYVPSFNDGEPCTFRVADFYEFDKEGLLAYCKENGDDPGLLETDEKKFFRSCGLSSFAQGEVEAIKEIGGTGWVEPSKDILERAFGHNQVILITQTGVYTDYYYNY